MISHGALDRQHARQPARVSTSSSSASGTSAK